MGFEKKKSYCRLLTFSNLKEILNVYVHCVGQDQTKKMCSHCKQ